MRFSGVFRNNVNQSPKSISEDRLSGQKRFCDKTTSQVAGESCLCQIVRHNMDTHSPNCAMRPFPLLCQVYFSEYNRCIRNDGKPR